MKKLILLMVFAALAIGAAWGQKPFYGEWYYTENDEVHPSELHSKVWDNGKVMRTEEARTDGKPGQVVLLFPDSICIITGNIYMTFTGEEMKKRKHSLGLGMERLSSVKQKKFIKQETVSGFLCNHYLVTRRDVSKSTATGQVRESGSDEEIWETPEIRHEIKSYNASGKYILKNIVVGAQPSHLFTIPKDCKRIAASTLMKGLLNNKQGKPEDKKSSDQRADKTVEGFKALEELLKKKK